MKVADDDACNSRTGAVVNENVAGRALQRRIDRAVQPRKALVQRAARPAVRLSVAVASEPQCSRYPHRRDSRARPVTPWYGILSAYPPPQSNEEWPHELSSNEATPLLPTSSAARRTASVFGLELIASENYTSAAVLEAMGSVLTNKYAEGYPGKRYYGGCEVVDEAELLAIARVKELFGAEHANVQSNSGAEANLATYFALIKPGDTAMGMNLAQGGHLTHGREINFSGKLYNFIPYSVDREDERIDYDEMARLAKEHKPKIIVVGATAYPRIIDFARSREIADSVGAYLMTDMAHIAGLVAAGAAPVAGTVLARRDFDGAQDAAGAAQRVHPLEGGDRPADRQDRVPGRAGRAAHAHHRGQGRLLRRGARRLSSSTTPSRSWTTRRRSAKSCSARVTGWSPAARTTT